MHWSYIFLALTQQSAGMILIVEVQNVSISPESIFLAIFDIKVPMNYKKYK